MDADGQLRNLRDFLLVYNRMTEICFQRCSSNFNYRNLTMDEERCTDNCAGKLIRSNHRLMGTYVKLMPAMVQRRMEEMESKVAEAAKAAEAAGPAQTSVHDINTSQMPTSSAPAQAVTPITDAVPALPLITDHTHTAGAESPVTLSTRGSLEQRAPDPASDIGARMPASLSGTVTSIPVENISTSASSNSTALPGHQRATQENTPS